MPSKSSFEINAMTKNYSEILKNQKTFIVPEYQRPYSWEYEQVERFINDIFLGFWGNDRKSVSEPFFAGSIQLSNQNKIIDGQQRLTTLLILQKVLNLYFFHNETLINAIVLVSEVNNGTQNDKLKEFLNIKTSKSLELKI